MSEERQHSVLGASSSHRWLNCPGSRALIERLGLASETSEYAAEGTVAHEVAATCLREGREPWEFIGETLSADGFTFVVDAEMADAVQLYIDTLLADANGARGELWIEAPVHLSQEHPDLWGTLDAAHVKPPLLRIIDFKYGKGLVVEPEENPQLLQYAAMAMNVLGEEAAKIETVELVIVQPRAPHHLGPVRRWRLSSDSLGEWIAATLLPGARKTADPEAPLQFGEWCRFCPAAERCPERLKRVKIITGLVQETPPEEMDVRAMEDWELGEQLDLENTVRRYFEMLREEAFRRLMNGGSVPGQKLVRGVTQRIWKDGAEEVVLAALGDEALTEPKVKSPAQVEKIGKKGKSLAAEWAFKPEGKLTSAPVSDKREAVKVDPNDTFGDLIE